MIKEMLMPGNFMSSMNPNQTSNQVNAQGQSTQ